MITLDQSALSQSLQRWNQSVALKQAVLGQAAEKTVLVEAGRLVESLIKLTPSAKKDNIQIDVKSKFVSLNLDHVRQTDGPAEWYAFQPNAIFGVAKDQDMSGASVEELYRLNKTLKVNKQGRVIAGKRGKQTVYIWKKIVTKAATVNALIAKLKKHVGRRAAGWLVSWNDLKMIGLKSSYNPPQYIAQHSQGARGYSINGLGIKGSPEFTIENHAIGIENRSMDIVVQAALNIRADAMTKRLEYLVKYPERISEET